MAEVIDFGRNKKTETTPVLKEGTFEFHLHSSDEELVPAVVTAKGYLKFGPVFIAVVDTPEDTSNIMLALATNLVKYVKRLDEDGAIEGTLSV